MIANIANKIVKYLTWRARKMIEILRDNPESIQSTMKTLLENMGSGSIWKPLRPRLINKRRSYVHPMCDN